MDNIRLIDANALIQEIREYSKAYYFNSSAERDNHFAKVDYAIDRISEAPTADTWIPVSVQEPAIGGIYLVTAKHISSGHIGTDIARRISRDIWTFGGDELSGTEIIAWKPLPEPYREVEND